MKTLKYILTLLLPFWLLLAISLYWFAGLITADVELLLSGATPELAAATHSHITMGLGLIIVLISICFVVTMLTHWRASVKLIELKMLFRAAPCGILTIDSKGRVRKANNQAMQLFGIARGQTKQLHIDQLLPLELQFAQTKISQSLVDEVGVADLNNMSSQFFARKLNGDEFPINLSVSNALARGEKNSIMIIKDVSFENKLINEAQTDGLTKVNNRKASEDFLATAVNRANRYNVKLSAILLDIDHFSKINTRIGRDHADQLLIDIAQIINKNMRDTDFLSRWGGEEFLIICQDTDAEEALLFAEKIRGTIAKHYQDQAIKVTVSLGVSHFIYGQDDETSLVKRAHRAVAKAKLMGRNRSALISAQTNAADEELE